MVVHLYIISKWLSEKKHEPSTYIYIYINILHIVVWWKFWQKHHCLPNIEPANQSSICQDTSGGLVWTHINENGTLWLSRYFEINS